VAITDKSILRKQLTDAGLGRLASAIQAQTKPSLRLTATKPSAQPVSRLGGRPNLPKEIRWPVWQNEVPLAFIAQLDLATLPSVRGLPLPKTGALFFFYDATEQPWGYDPKHRGGAQVIYSPSPLSAHGVRALHRDVDEEARFRGLAVTSTPEVSLPSHNHPLFRELQATEAEWNAYMAFHDPFQRAVHRIGGHGNEIQGELSLAAERGSKRKGADSTSSDWLLLLQVDSEPRTGTVWGDGGRIFFMMQKDDLRRRRFDCSWLILQCT